MTAQVYVVIDKAENTLIVPSAAIKKGRGDNNAAGGKRSAKQGADAAKNSATNKPSANNKGSYVRVLKADGSVEDRPVTVGIDNRVNAQILSGLKAGEAVIIGENSGAPGKQQSRGRRPLGM